MSNFRDKLARFMYGRYGSDQLNNALTLFCLVLIILNAFLQVAVINLLVWAVLVWSIYRTFSRNVTKRSIENQKFLKVWDPVKGKASLVMRRFKEIKTHRYRKCPQCKAVLRLPRRTGIHTVDCPRCHNEFQVRIRL